MKVKPIKHLKGFFIQFVDQDKIILSKGLTLYTSDLELKKIKKLVTLPSHFLFNLLARFKLSQRFFRLFIYNIVS